MTSRRGFLSSMIVAAVLDPERLLWVPGARTISIPKPAMHVGVDQVAPGGGETIWWFCTEGLFEFGPYRSVRQFGLPLLPPTLVHRRLFFHESRPGPGV